ncbi:lytic murein transglycosylase [Pararoseomonas indoligenes]|uniref:Lytic murein transglycosylase n=1 Tax=Roseomonas indoligenes TaxID=2820811 RepID=A0A940N0D7_9PROT|nr:lytic murein transglycosylase [Pararoseomonas indoligenes]MBP0492965.1 lytic murein transglycosylase [Pararoseomonas indoligenes]
MNRPGRRSVLALPLLALAAPARAQQMSWDSFLDGLRADARRAGISSGTVQRALGNIQPLDRVIELDRRQPEGTMTWDRYRELIVSQTRIDNGRRAFAENRALLQSLEDRFRVPARVMVAIWGMETSYGTNMGSFNVVNALATLVWEGRRERTMRPQLMAALRIIDAGNIAAEGMRGSWSGAMGHPQFMPQSYEQYAVDADGDGRKDIWNSKADALGSIGNYLSRFGWRMEERWGREVTLPAGFDPYGASPDRSQPLRDWARQGLTYADGSAIPPSDMTAAVVVPGANNGSQQAFLVYRNWSVIRRYNNSVYYATAVGMLSDRVA